MSCKHIHPLDLLSQKTQDTCVLDLRTAAEVKTERLPGCLHIPLQELTAQRLQEQIKQHKKDGSCIYLLCQSGKRAEMAAQQLADNAPGELIIVEGGINALKHNNIALQCSGGKTISLERQVRIAAGLLVFTGVVLGTWVNPGFYALSGFVGAGLVFAGVTDTCAMGMLIARMPWNR